VLLLLQIAAGIVVGGLILRYWSELVQWGLEAGKVIAVVAGIAVVVVGFAWFFQRDPENARLILLIGCVAAFIKYGARGLGYGYVKCAPYLRRSPRARRAASLLGADQAWAFSDRKDRQFVDAVGDRLFLGIPLRILLAVAGVGIVAVGILSGAEAVGLIPHSTHPTMFMGTFWGCTSLVVIGATAWCLRAPRE
jgi:hypothetical protein